MILSRITYRNVISTFEKERENNKKAIEQTKKYADSLIRERDLVRKELVKCNSKFYHLSNHLTVINSK